MKTTILTLLCLVMLGVATTSYAQAKRKTTFTSAYTGLGRGCHEIAGSGGTDGLSICRGPGGYQVRVYYSAASTQINAEIKGKDDNFPLATLDLGFDLNKARVEWRLANGKPFAAILRVPTYADPTGVQYFGKVIGEELVVKGLKGFGNIDAAVNAKRPNANAEARAAADQGYVDAMQVKFTDLTKPGP
jgi:hypothetical protein